jgi:hypothetical protein
MSLEMCTIIFGYEELKTKPCCCNIIQLVSLDENVYYSIIWLFYLGDKTSQIRNGPGIETFMFLFDTRFTDGLRAVRLLGTANYSRCV